MEEQKTTKEEWKERELGALWSYEGKSGKYLQGYVEIEGKRHQVVCFKNVHKQEGEKTPDVRIYLDKKQNDQDEDLPI